MFSMIMPALARARSPELLELAEGPTRRFAPQHAGAEPGRAEPPEVTGIAIGHCIAQVGVKLEIWRVVLGLVRDQIRDPNP